LPNLEGNLSSVELDMDVDHFLRSDPPRPTPTVTQLKMRVQIMTRPYPSEFNSRILEQ